MNGRNPLHRCSVLVGAAAWLVLGSCATLLTTRIAAIKKAPSAYDGTTVTVSGKVTSAHNLVLVKYFTLNDGTGEIPVVTQSELPKEGESVHVKGKVDQAFVLGDARLVVIVEEPPKR